MIAWRKGSDAWRQFQSTHSITECDMSFCGSSQVPSLVFQSTHSITECDQHLCDCIVKIINFNPRTPLQSAMVAIKAVKLTLRDFNPRTPLQSAIRWPLPLPFFVALRFQSTHSITECDITKTPRGPVMFLFQSTHSITECDRSGRPFGQSE